MADKLAILALSNTELAKALYNGNLAEEEIKALPAQTVYTAVKTIGLESSQDIISALSHKQYEIALDFEFWSNDIINEDNIWNWLSIIDDPKGFESLDRFIKEVDQNILVFLITKYVQIEVNEEQTESPPFQQGYTPDLGFTWLAINTGDDEHDRQLGKILAYIFESDPDYFYRLIYLPNTCTPSILEEESFALRNSRLQGEGIPDKETAWRVNSPKTASAILPLLKSKPDFNFTKKSNYPLLHGGYASEPLRGFIQDIIENDTNLIFEIEQNLAGLLNSAIIYCNIDFSNFDIVKRLSEQVKGAINLGLEALIDKLGKTNTEYDNFAIYKQIGIQNIYQIGLNELKQIHSAANKILKNIENKNSDNNIPDSKELVILDALAKQIPEFSLLIHGNNSPDTLTLKQETKPFEHLTEIEQAKIILNHLTNTA